VTVDGSLSAQYEHTLLVTKDGVEVLTAWPDGGGGGGEEGGGGGEAGTAAAA
jgi:hypothetical protein